MTSIADFIVSKPLFEIITILVIFINSIFLAIDDPKAEATQL